jgi:hypothetical protein
MKEKNHNLFFFMVDTWLKSLRLISLVIEHEQGAFIVKEYDRKSLYLI